MFPWHQNAIIYSQELQRQGLMTQLPTFPPYQVRETFALEALLCLLLALLQGGKLHYLYQAETCSSLGIMLAHL